MTDGDHTSNIYLFYGATIMYFKECCDIEGIIMVNFM